MSNPLSGDVSDRVAFKIEAAKYHLDKLRSLVYSNENILGGYGRFQAEVLIEAFVVSIYGASEALHVNGKQKLRKANRADLIEEVLLPLERSSKKYCWLWRVREFRNMSAHTQYMSRDLELGPEGRKMYLRADPTNPKSRRYNLELLPDLERMLSQTEKLVSTIQSDPRFLNPSSPPETEYGPLFDSLSRPKL